MKEGCIPAPPALASSWAWRVSATVRIPCALALVLGPLAVAAQAPPVVPFSQDAFLDHIADPEPLLVNVSEFVELPPTAWGSPQDLQALVDVPGAGRLIVSTFHGTLWAVSYDGAEVSTYLDIAHAREAVVPSGVRSGVEGFGGSAFHPQFAVAGTPGFGKFYTLLEVSDTEPPADFTPRRSEDDFLDTVLLEWTARDPTAWTYDGGPPRELMRIEQPYTGHRHHGGAIHFRPGAGPSAPDYGLLYAAIGDGGSSGGVGDPMDMAQDLGKVYGKLLRIDPLGSNSANGRYGIPADNPFAGDGREETLGEIWAYGMRNPNSFGWDASNGKLYVADIGEDTTEEISLVSAGSNLGWSAWEGSFRVVRRRLQYRGLAYRFAKLWSWATHSATDADFPSDNGPDAATAEMRDPGVTYPVVEYDRHDPLFWLTGYVAVTGVVVCRECNVPQLNGKVLFGDVASGVLMYFPADGAPTRGGPESIRQVLLVDSAGRRWAGGRGKTLLKLVQEKRVAQGRDQPGHRVDLRFGTSASGDVFLITKRDGVIRRLHGPREVR